MSKNYRGSGSFATFLIIGPICFFLGILFASFPYDFPLLWSPNPVTPLHISQIETHLRFMHAAPPLISRLLHLIIAVGFLGFFTKLYRASESNFLFDGGSLLLYLIAAGVYITNVVTPMNALAEQLGDGGNEEGERVLHTGPLTGEVELTREESLRVLSASHTILAFVLVGVLVLQAGQWYAEKRESEDYAAWVERGKPVMVTDEEEEEKEEAEEKKKDI
ncbi:Shr3 amino acid permease chaperone [Triangularia verruculosa]|uniref:Shr3 amino acid permease chaperone n=1 Tax=Triangularia verruculosa TaxID=2587418 RepID=A0AAN6XT75_9PEZI|nr:Shr3 amino acid permease chaperone [Triangularia verruculosa]